MTTESTFESSNSPLSTFSGSPTHNLGWLPSSLRHGADSRRKRSNAKSLAKIPGVVLRAGTRQDIPGVAELCGPDDYLHQAWPEWMHDGRGVGVIAEMDGRVVGCVHATPVSSTDVFSQGLRVDPSYRRRGIAAGLMATKNSLAHQRGFQTLRATVDFKNHAARSLCHGLGMRCVESISRRRHFSWRGGANLPPMPSSESASALARQHGLLASRPAHGVFKRFYFSPQENWLEETRWATVDESAITIFDQDSDDHSPWITAVAGSPESVRRILDGLRPPVGEDSIVVTLDAPDDPALHHMLDQAGFEAAGPNDRYVIFEGPTGPR